MRAKIFDDKSELYKKLKHVSTAVDDIKSDFEKKWGMSLNASQINGKHLMKGTKSQKNK